MARARSTILSDQKTPRTETTRLHYKTTTLGLANGASCSALHFQPCAWTSFLKATCSFAVGLYRYVLRMRAKALRVTGDWQVMWDGASGKEFYYNATTDVSQWDMSRWRQI